MGVANRKSGTITNRDSVPRVANNPGAAAGMLRGFLGTLESVSGDDIASTYRMGRVPSRACMHALRLYSDDNGTTTVADIGLYRTTEDGGAVVDADFFASAVNLNAGALNGTDILHESGIFTLENSEKPLWQALGLAVDPCVDYDVAFTLTAASDAAATLALKGQYAL